MEASKNGSDNVAEVYFDNLTNGTYYAIKVVGSNENPDYANAKWT